MDESQKERLARRDRRLTDIILFIFGLIFVAWGANDLREAATSLQAVIGWTTLIGGGVSLSLGLVAMLLQKKR